jgi:hypothetical protein
MRQKLDRMGRISCPAAISSPMTRPGTRFSVTSSAVSIIDRTKPLMPKP